MFSPNNFLSIYVILFSGISAIVLVTTQEVPASPCPEVFQYDTQSNGEVYGRITIPYDGSSNLRLGVNASMKGYYTDNNQVKLRLKMTTPGQDLIQRRTNSLSYDIYFPFQNAVPKITKIEYNHRGYCSGPPEELIPGAPGVTSLWTGHNYFFQSGNGNPTLFPPKPVQSIIPEENVQPVEPNQRFPVVAVSFPSSSNQVTDAPPPQPSQATVDFPPQTSQATVNSSSPSNQKVECGVSKNFIVPLIIGGKEIGDGMFPWLAAMFTSSGDGYQYKCTANLISDTHVVTAARCVNFFKLQVVQTEDILFIFGKSNLKNWATSGAVTRGAAAIHTNPDFNANSGHGDITVIKLDRPVEFSQTIAPICLWDGDDNLNDIVDKKGMVAGWGADEGAQKSGRFSTSVAKTLEMPVVSQDSCLFSNLSFFQLTSDITFCAGNKDGSGTCIGDSGAGFMMNRNGKYYLRGLASLILSEKGKCDLTSFMVFCDAAKLKDWIKESMKK